MNKANTNTKKIPNAKSGNSRTSSNKEKSEALEKAKQIYMGILIGDLLGDDE